MLTVFDVDHSVGADTFDFKELCPAFIQQAKSGACTESSETQPETEKDMGKSKFNVIIEGKEVLQIIIISHNLSKIKLFVLWNSLHHLEFCCDSDLEY